MLGVLMFLILLVPIIELWVIIGVWHSIGGVETLALLLMVSIAGAWLVRREGLGVWGRLNDQLARGELPGIELVDGALILFAGALLLTPGFVTDAVGILLLLPPVRAGLRALGRHRLEARLTRYGPMRLIGFGARGFDSATSATRWGSNRTDVTDVRVVDPPELEA